MITKKTKKTRNKSALFSSIVIGLLAFGLISFLVVSNLRISQKRAELTGRIEVLKKEIQILEQKNQELRTAIAMTAKESYWEARAREQGYIREGEHPVVILPAEETPHPSPVEEGFWQKILEKIGL